MKWITLLLLGVLAEGSVADDCNSTQKVDARLIGDQFTIGESSVRPLNIRNTIPAAEKFAERFIKARADYGSTIGTVDYNQILEIGQDLIKAIKDDWAKLKESIDDTTIKFTPSNRINKDLKQLNEQLETFLGLKPGNQKIELDLNDMPPKPKFKSDTKNLTAADAFLHLAKIKDDDIAAEGAYAAAIYWSGWKKARKVLRLFQTQFRNQVLNNQVMPVYKKIVDKVYSLSEIKNCVDEETWSSFEAARKSIVKLSNEYIKSLENCDSDT